MNLQLFYPLQKEQQFTDDARVTRGIAFTTHLPDGSKCYSIRTCDKMVANLTTEPCTDWNELIKTNPMHKDCIMDVAPYLMRISSGSPINDLLAAKYPVTENPPLF